METWGEDCVVMSKVLKLSNILVDFVRVGITVRFSLRFIGCEEESKGVRTGKCRFTVAVGRVGRGSSAWWGSVNRGVRLVRKLVGENFESFLTFKDLLMPLQRTYPFKIAVDSIFQPQSYVVRDR